MGGSLWGGKGSQNSRTLGFCGSGQNQQAGENRGFVLVLGPTAGGVFGQYWGGRFLGG